MSYLTSKYLQWAASWFVSDFHFWKSCAKSFKHDYMYLKVVVAKVQILVRAKCVFMIFVDIIFICILWDTLLLWCVVFMLHSASCWCKHMFMCIFGFRSPGFCKIPKWALTFFLDKFAVSYSNVERRKSLSPSAIVIGAGFAGIAAAHALKNANFQVIWLSQTIVSNF